MSPVERRIRPYSIDNPDWEQPGALVEEIRDENGLDKVSSIMSVYSKVYGIAKVVYVAFVSFGIEVSCPPSIASRKLTVQLDDFPMGFLFHIKRAEDYVRSVSLAELKEMVENLYYAVYARLIAEMANVELCSSFTVDIRRASAKDTIVLPEPSHMYKIFLSCKEILDSPSTCSELNKHTIQACQEGFIRRIANRVSTGGFSLDDVLGYRRHILAEVSNELSPFCQKWHRLSVVYRMPAAEVLAVLSEKYLAIMPKAPIPGEIPVSDLPFINPDTIRPDVWERQIILDHRQATLAKLEGKSIGDIRRENNGRRLLDFVKERKCVCPSTCDCAHDCTMNIERPCPCAPRMMRIMVAKRRRGPGAQTLGDRCSGLAKAIFDGLAVISRHTGDSQMVDELGLALQLIEEEIQKECMASE